MTTDPPPAELEDVRIGNWQCRLPSAICTNKEIFDEIFSLETWKTVLQPDQRDRILKMLPPEVLKTPGAAEKTIEDLFSKSLSNFDGNPLDTFYDKLENGHYDPEVVETKANIVREWRRESLRLRKHYHTKLLQDIVISRDKHLRKLIPPSPVHKKNGKRSISSNNGPTKKNGSKGITSALTTTNGNATNGLSSSLGGTKAKNSHQQNNVKTEITVASNTNNSVRNTNKTTDQSSGSNKNKRGRLEAALLSPPNPVKDVSSSTEGPSKKKAKSSASKSKGKKSKDTNSSAAVTQPPPSPSSQLINSPLLMGNGGGTGAHQKTSLLLGTLTSGSSPLEPPTLSLRSPSSLSGTTSSSSLLESLTSPVNPVSHLTPGNESNGGLSKQYSKIFPSPILTSSPVSTSQSSSFLPSPVQSSPILASQLQAPSPISVNLSSITGGGLSSSRNGSISGSLSHSSITLNYTQPPTPTSLPPPSSTITSLQQSGKGLMEDDSSSDEFEFETIEPTIGFSGPSSVNKSSGANLKSSTAPSGYGSTNSSSSTTKKLAGTISSQELANIQKCSLLTNCLTQPLSSNSSSAAAVSAALANNILTSTPVPASATVALSGGSSAVQQLLQQQQSQQNQKIIVTSSGIVTTSSSVVPPPSPLQQQQQLQKFLTTVSNASPNMNTGSQKVVAHPQQQQQQIDIFQQQLQKNVISTPSSTGPVSAVDAQTFVNTLMASSKDLLSAFSSSIGGVTTTPEIHQMQVQQQHNNSSTTSTVLPISVNLQGVQEHQKQATFIRTTGSVMPQQQQQQQQLLSLQSTPTAPPPIVVVGQGSSLNTQSLQLPSSILAGSSNISSNKVSSIAGVSTTSVVATSASIPNLLDSDDLNLSLGSFTLGGLGGMNLDLGTNLQDIDSNGVGTVDGMKLEMDCGMDKMDDLSGVLDGNPFDSIPNLSDELDGLDLDMVDGLCDFEVLLSEEKQYGSFFSLIRDVLCSTRDHRMTLVCLEKTVKKWTTSPGAALNPWYIRVHDWSYALIVGLNFLAGNYQDVHPEDFVPYIEYKYETKYYQWIGAGRDGDNNLTPLCTLWMDNLDKLPPLRKSEVDGDEPEEEEDDNEDSDTGLGGDPSEPKKKNKRPQTPPPPRCTTEWAVRPSTDTEKEDFRQQEKHRFENPHKAFTYRMHGYESVVGPVKGVYSSQTGITNKARGHSLLVDDRPPYVTILALVRDAVARLPNGEGTRSEICEMLRDSAFLAPEASNVTLNSVVSGALDRLHYERDPCVRYDSHKKSWIYLHRDRSQEQFERLHHNRSYTKSTKSRNNSNRKSRKGSKSSSTAVAVATGTSQSSSSSSSQCSTSAIVESSLQNAVVSNSANLATAVGSTSGKTNSASNSPLVALPSLSTINPSLQSQLTTLASSVGGITSVTQQQLQQQPAKQAIVLVSVTNPTGIQVQTQQTTGLAGALQQSLATVAASRGGLVSIPASSAMTIQDGAQQTQQQQQQASLNDVLAAATGLRFQTSSTGAPIVLNQNILGTGHQQGKPQQATFIQETGGSGATARLVLQQSQQTGALSATMQQGTSTQAIQVQSQQQGVQGPTAATIAPGQILLNSSAAAVLKLAGNIRLGEGLRLAQLRLPGASGQPGTASLAQASSPLRLPQHRILLARGTLPGQSQAQGVLLGQTSTGQTVILSAGPAGAGPLAGLQQALAAGGSGATGQIQLHAAPPQTIQLDNSSASSVSGQHQQAHHQQSGITQQSLQAFTTNQTGSSATTSTKFGIITNVPGGNSLVVSSGASSSPLIQGNYSTMARIQQSSQLTQQTNSPSTLPPTSISLPASLLSSSQTLSPVSTGNVTMLSPPNVTVSTSQLPPQQQQQLILTSGSGGSLSQGQHQSTTQQQIGTLGMQTIQLQSGVQQQQQSHQSLILQQSQQNLAQSGSAQQQSQTQQAHHQLTAPIIIRSAQGDFVSFGIPSHLSLGRGVQGIKVIPFQAGKQTVLARIVAPPPPTSLPSTSGAPTSTIAVPSSVSSLLSGSSTLTSNNFNNTIANTIANITTSSNSTVPATVQLTKVPAASSSTTLSFSSTQNLNPTITYSTVMSTLSTSPAIVSQPTISLPTASLMSLPPHTQQSPMTTSGSTTTPMTTIHGGVAVTTVSATNNNSIVVNNQSSNVTAIAPTSTITTATVHNVSSSS